jgi:hypothetical protein
MRALVPARRAGLHSRRRSIFTTEDTEYTESLQHLKHSHTRSRTKRRPPFPAGSEAFICWVARWSLSKDFLRHAKASSDTCAATCMREAHSPLNFSARGKTSA